jgi:HAD superfamily hydrolase (TIGR01549 family)
MKFILFDLDDTFVNSQAAYDFAMNAIGVSPTSPAFLEARQKVKEQLPSKSPVARSRLHYFKKMLEIENRFSHSRLKELSEGYENAVVQHMKKQWETLEREKFFRKLSQSSQWVVVTNETLRMQMLKLQAFDPSGSLFPHVLTSEELGFEKPDPRFFSLGLQKLGSHVENTVMVGDNFKLDIEVPLNLGLKCFWTQEFKKEPEFSSFTHPNLEKLNHLNQLLDFME